MAVGCKIGRHLAPNPYLAMRGDGIWFGECPACLQEIIKKDGQRWRTVPPGYRVIWPRITQKGAVPQLVPLDRVGRANLPAVRDHGPFAWLRRLFRGFPY